MRKRSIRFRGRREKKEVFDVDITSLLDVLVILLVFLLKSYDSTGLLIQIPDGISLPLSKSKSMNVDAVMVHVSPTTMWIDDETVIETEGGFDFQNPEHFDLSGHGGRLIIPLYSALREKKDTIDKIKTMSPEAKEFSGIVNLVVDKTIKYSFLKKILYTCAEAGFRKYKFVVLSDSD